MTNERPTGLEDINGTLELSEKLIAISILLGNNGHNLVLRQLSLNCWCGHMKWSHGFILGTEVG